MENEKDLGVIIKDIPIELIDENTGQIEGVPTNPRKIPRDKFTALVRSIRQSPEMRELDEVKVFPKDGRYVVISGNHRLMAYRHLKWKTVLCKVLPEDTPKDKLREYLMKENMQYAQNDERLLLGWDIKELDSWDIPVKGIEKHDVTVGDVEFTRVLDEEHNYIVLYFDNKVDWLQAQTLLGIKDVRLLSTAKGRDNKNGYKFGVGRVLRGADVIDRLTGAKGVEAESEENNDEDIS